MGWLGDSYQTAAFALRVRLAVCQARIFPQLSIDIIELGHVINRWRLMEFYPIAETEQGLQIDGIPEGMHVVVINGHKAQRLSV